MSQDFQSPQSVSSAFQNADAFTAREEGGYTRNDGTGHAANFGIDQNAHPGVNVGALSSSQAQGIRSGYWQAIGGDHLAARDPRLATIAYDTAIMSGPAKAQQLIAQSGGDPARYLALRSAFQNNLVANNPAKFGPVAAGWQNRNNALAAAVGLNSPQSAPLPALSGLAPPAPGQAASAPGQAASAPGQAPPVDWGAVLSSLAQPAAPAQLQIPSAKLATIASSQTPGFQTPLDLTAGAAPNLILAT